MKHCVYSLWCQCDWLLQQTRFRPAAVKDCIHQILSDFFVGKSYASDECTAWCKEISHEIKGKLKGDLQL